MNSRSEEIRPADRPAARLIVDTAQTPEIRLSLPTTGHDSSASVDSAERVGEARAPNNRQGSLGVRRLSHLVNERDLAILGSVRQHRLIQTRHLYELHFWNHATHASGIRACTRVLARLEGHRFIRRLARPVGGHGGGSGSTVWALDVAGDRLLRRTLGELGRTRIFEPSLLFQAHTLAVADTRVAFEQAARRGDFELLTVQTEPDCWRDHPGQLGAVSTLKPDLYLVTADGDFEDHWFLEIDMGTESPSALRRKLDAYRRYRSSGIEQHQSGVFPRVVWIVPDDRRRAVLAPLIRTDEHALFAITTPERLLDIITHKNAPEPTQEGGSP